MKVAVVIRAFEWLNVVWGEDFFESVLIHTGQHYDDNMSTVFIRELEIPEPDYNLGVGSGTHGAQTGRMLEAIEAVLLKEKPDCVLVYGDTNSTLAGALAAAKLHIPVGHVEAGLRSYNRKMPEEINRVLTDHISSFLFCPSRTACRNLAWEGFDNVVLGGDLIPKDAINKSLIQTKEPVVLNVGDVMVDALQGVAASLPPLERLDDFPYRAGEYLVLTLHRAENVDSLERFTFLLEALRESPLPIVFPVHPRTKVRLLSFGLEKLVSEYPFDVKEPLGYKEMLRIVRDAALVLTDSGGLQKEAFLLGVPCVTLRTETEWVETVEAGWNTLVPCPEKGFLAKKLAWAEKVRSFEQPHPYGDGKASARIADFIFALKEKIE